MNGPWPIRPSDRRSLVGHDSDVTWMDGTRYKVLEQVVVRRADRWSYAVGPVLGLWGGPALLFSIFVALFAPTALLFTILGGIFAVVVPVTYLVAAFGRDSYLVVEAGSREVGRAPFGRDEHEGRAVGLYGLSKITLRRARWKGLVLHVVEPGGRPLDLPLGALEVNQQLWDLVYNGLVHRAAAGAEVDPWTREQLRLPSPRP